MPGAYGMYERSPAQGALRQGEIITDLIQHAINLRSLSSGGDLEVERRVHPFTIVLTQDCDLDWDYRAKQDTSISSGKLIPNILFCEVDTAENLKRNLPPGSDIWKLVKSNRDERYHFFEQIKKEWDYLDQGLPELGCDFKRYFTIPADEVYWLLGTGAVARRCVLSSPYMQHFVSRFYVFQSRIALPGQDV